MGDFFFSVDHRWCVFEELKVGDNGDIAEVFEKKGKPYDNALH